MSPDMQFLEDVLELKRLLLQKQRSLSNQVRDAQMQAVLSAGARLEEQQLGVLQQELNRLQSKGGAYGV